MDSLLKHYEIELAALNAQGQDFAGRYPKIAGRLGIEGNSSKDPHMERLIQAYAMLGARTAKRLEDSYSEFTESLLEVNFPHYLRPFPCCAIACVDGAQTGMGKLTGVSTIPRGTVMHAVEQEGVICKFSTAYEIAAGPFRLVEVRFQPVVNAPAAARLPAGTGSAISITVESTASSYVWNQPALSALRLFIDAEQSLSATLRDSLFVRARCAYVEPAGDGWQALTRIPIAAVGFASEDALIPFKPTSHPAYRILTEYFAFPDKFNFFDMDLDAIAPLLPAACRRFTLHVILNDLHGSADLLDILRPLSRQHLRTGCSPVVNLFRQAARPIHLTHEREDYPLVAESRQPHAFDIYSVDAVNMVRTTVAGNTVTQFHPLYSLKHGDAGGRRGHYWITRRDEALALTNPGYDTSISFIDADMRPMRAATETVSIELTCSNREVPTRLAIGAAGGDLQHEAAASNLPVSLLRKPSKPYRFATGKDAQWRLISHLSLNHQSLSQQGLPVLKEILELYNLPASDVTQRQIEGITALGHRSASFWLQDGHGGSLVYGIDVQLTIDETAYIGGGLHIFAQVIEHFLAMYVQFNSFTRLIVCSQQSGKELIRCLPRSGMQALA